MLPAQDEVDQGFSDQQQAYQEGHRQRFLNERYERLMQQENAAAPTAVAEIPAAQEPEEQTDGFTADNEMTDYIQEEDEEEDPYYFVQPQERPHGDVYQAARVGDVQRVRSLVEDEGIDVNLRDTWDAVPLYYACLAGHNEVVEFLLKAGAVCNEYTFDGDRCHYAALNLGIRTLLRQFEARPPPLSPLATSLRALCALTENPEAVGTSQAGEPMYCDFAFVVGGERIPLHRALLAARSKYLKNMLTTQWLPKAGEATREVNLGHPRLSPVALKALLIWMYTERLDIAIEEVDPLLAVMRKCKLKHMVQCILKERRTLRYYFKSTRKDEAPRRFVLQPGMLPEEARLAHDLLQLRLQAATLQEQSCRGSAADFADLLVMVDNTCFRVHRSILAARSDFFRAFLQRSPTFLQHPQNLLQQSPAWQAPVMHQPSIAQELSTTTHHQTSKTHLSPQAVEPHCTSGMPTLADHHSPLSTSMMGTHSGSTSNSQQHVSAPHQAASSFEQAQPAIVSSSSAEAPHMDMQNPERALSTTSHSDQSAELSSSSISTKYAVHAAHASDQPVQTEAASSSGREHHLPMIAVSDVTSDVFELVLEFMYSGMLRFLAPKWLKAANAELLFEAADWYLMPLFKREVAEHVVAALETSGGSMDQLCRLLLAADAFQVVLLRNYCLAGLAQAFRSLTSHTTREQAVFEAFVDAVAPKGTGDLLDGSNVPGASKGNIEGGGASGLGLGTVLQDLRETYLQLFGGTGKERDQAAKVFDAQLCAVAAGDCLKNDV